jgi:hypothetical protein
MIEQAFELIKAVSPILSASIAGGFAVLLGRHKKAKANLLQAYKDIYFLQYVEIIHSDMNVGREHKCNKAKVRKIARSEVDFTFSGITPSETQRKISKLSL